MAGQLGQPQNSFGWPRATGKPDPCNVYICVGIVIAYIFLTRVHCLYALSVIVQVLTYPFLAKRKR